MRSLPVTPDQVGPVNQQRWITAAILVSFAGLLVAGVSTRSLVRRVAQSGAQVVATHDALDKLARAFSLMQELETGARGYLLTGNADFLTQYDAAIAELDPALLQLREVYQDRPEHTAHWIKLEEAIRQERTLVAGLIDKRKRFGEISPNEVLQSKISMDAIRTSVTTLRDSDIELLRAGQAEDVDLTARGRRAVFIEGLLSVALLSVVVFLLHHENVRRRRAEGEVRTLNADLESRVVARTRELHASEHRLYSVLDTLMEGCQVVGFNEEYLYVNPVASQHARHAAREMIGRTMAEVFPGIESTDVYHAIQQCLVHRTVHRLDTRFEFPDGGATWFGISIEPIPEGAFVFTTDISGRIAAEAAMQGSEARHRELMQSLPDLVFLLDRNGVFLDFHAPEGSELLTAPSEFLGRSVRDVLPPTVAAETEAALARAFQEGKKISFGYQLDLPHGTRLYDATMVPSGADGVAVFSRDVTEQRDLESQLRQAQKMEAVGQLTGGIAHDFNNVLTVIGSHADLVLEQLPQDSAAREDLHELTRAVRHGAEMIDRLMRFSRRGRVERRLHNPTTVVEDFVPLLRRLLPESVQLCVHHDEQPATILLDPGSLQQIVVNLCTNARDAMPDGGTITLINKSIWLDPGYHATHPWVRPGPYIRISVEDTGSGMNADTQRHLFEPFFTTKPAGVGTGLGMPMVYALMKEHEGMVQVYSEVGKGTTVNLYFPVVDGPQPEGIVVSGEHQIPGARTNETILVVEDEQGIRRAAVRSLTRQGYRVLEASDGEEALEVYGKHREEIALIISDLNMPRLGGRQLEAALRGIGSRIPILFSSGYSTETEAGTGEFPPGTAFLQKPWTLAQLYAAVRELLDRGPIP